jgi:hypothetical protein
MTETTISNMDADIVDNRNLFKSSFPSEVSNPPISIMTRDILKAANTVSSINCIIRSALSAELNNRSNSGLTDMNTAGMNSISPITIKE